MAILTPVARSTAIVLVRRDAADGAPSGADAQLLGKQQPRSVHRHDGGKGGPACVRASRPLRQWPPACLKAGAPVSITIGTWRVTSVCGYPNNVTSLVARMMPSPDIFATPIYEKTFAVQYTVTQ